MAIRIIKFLKIFSIASRKLALIKKRVKKKRSIPKQYYSLFQGKRGIEIGGPSIFFREVIGIYGSIELLDGANFSSKTIWEGEIYEGWTYNYGENKKGYQYICDAVCLEKIESSKYDFVLSCNSLEHIANPLKAIEEMLRILNTDGIIFLVLPDKSSNFDHNRKFTNFEHLLEDFNNDISEEDLTHLDEILELHDLSMDSPAGDFENFKKRSMNNFLNRCLHHHVFDMQLLKKIFNYFNLEILISDNTKTDLIIVGKKGFKSN